jgi:hypothetical protein
MKRALCSALTLALLGLASTAWADDKVMQAGSWSLGADTTFNYSSSSNETLPDKKEVTNSTLFLRLTPELGFFIIDNLELNLSAGLFVRQLVRKSDVEGQEEPETAPETNFLFELGARYFTPDYKGFSAFGGLGMGGYFGSSERNLTIEGTNGQPQQVVEPTDTAGFTVTGQLGAAYMMRERLQLRAGVALSYLIGSEDVPSQDESLGASTFNAGLTFGLHYHF